MNVSLLVPFRDEADTNRLANWRWLEARWRALTDWEIVVGTDDGVPFSKTVAVNDAYSRASGDMFVIADADSWMDVGRIEHGLEYAAKHGVLTIPWMRAHRLSQEDSEAIRSLPEATRSPVTADMLSRVSEYRPAPSTAAMIICIGREGFERVGGMDPRFRGWGAEDVAFALSCETLLGTNRILIGEAYALYHERSRNAEGRRIWEHDDATHNRRLGEAHWAARGNVRQMLGLCAAHPLPGAEFPVSAAPDRSRRPLPRHVKAFADRPYGGTRIGERIAL